MKKTKYIFLSMVLLTLTFMTTSCTSVLNPYHSSFQCPLSKLDEGKCESIPSAYHDALNSNNTSFNLLTMTNFSNNNNTPLRQQYQNSLYNKAVHLMNKPKTPIVVPPKVIRIYFMPYESNGQLFMGQYTYIFVGKPRWIFSIQQQSPSDAN
ncbi:MAG: TraV family lipoprotein [Thermoplasmata archaeon]